jgi:hypothetical protein
MCSGEKTHTPTVWTTILPHPDSFVNGISAAEEDFSSVFSVFGGFQPGFQPFSSPFRRFPLTFLPSWVTISYKLLQRSVIYETTKDFYQNGCRISAFMPYDPLSRLRRFQRGDPPGDQQAGKTAG